MALDWGDGTWKWEKQLDVGKIVKAEETIKRGNQGTV